MEKSIKKPSQQRSQKRMQQALQSAELLLASMPIEQISIPEIAKHSGVPRSSIYQFFPNMTAILDEITQQYMHSLLLMLQRNAFYYVNMPILDILTDCIQQTSQFYNEHHVASILILNGVMNPTTYKAQQSTIQIIAQNILVIMKHSHQAHLSNDSANVIEHLIEVTFSLMKYSYFKDGVITAQIQQDIVDLCKLYLLHKGIIRVEA